MYWLGGGSGGGKSTVARRLAERFGLRVYATDDVMGDHAARSSRADAPYLAAFAAMSMDERWVERSPEVMLETFHWFRGEAFGLIVEDLRALPADSRVVVEGFRLLPRLVAPLLADPSRAVWLLPTPAFRAAAFAGRGSAGDISSRTGDPVRAERNLRERDRLFTDRLAEETRRLGLRSVVVDPGVEEDTLVERVARGFGL
ncbi:hypothetical protein [Streptodolium elevatio]|uniref:Cytidylate kinase n=1 Tax=Streptodolium elevatio TaxID=3157996 RepID=A0ABV3DEA0_9ACTN